MRARAGSKKELLSLCLLWFLMAGAMIANVDALLIYYSFPCFFPISFCTARRLLSLEISLRRNVESRNCLVLSFGVSSITHVLLTPQKFPNSLPQTCNIKRVCLLCTPISFLFWITQVSLDRILLTISSSVTIMLILSPEVEYKGPYRHHARALSVPYLVLGRANPWWNCSGSSSSRALFFCPLFSCGLCHFFL